MTDTEILDYLQESIDRGVGLRDCQIGSVAFTAGLGSRDPRTLRELMIAAIEQDRQRRVNRVVKELKGR